MTGPTVECPHCGSPWTQARLGRHKPQCEWQMANLITSARSGRIWTRRMVYNACARQCGPGHGPAIRALLDDKVFMRLNRGVIPARIVDEIWLRVVSASMRIKALGLTHRPQASGRGREIVDQSGAVVYRCNAADDALSVWLWSREKLQMGES